MCLLIERVWDKLFPNRAQGSGRRCSHARHSATLKKQKTRLLQQISQLGDLRRGSIATLTRRCGKPRLPLRPARRPSSWPQLSLDALCQRQIRLGILLLAAALHKAQQEVAEHQKFRPRSRAVADGDLCRPAQAAALGSGSAGDGHSSRAAPSRRKASRTTAGGARGGGELEPPCRVAAAPVPAAGGPRPS